MSLHSKTNLKIIDAICEGTIDGLVNHSEGVFLDETAVTPEQTGEKSVIVRQRKGSQSQLKFDEKTGFSVFTDAATTVQDVSQKIGKSYSEPELTDKNTVKRRDYGPGQVVVDITDTTVDFVTLLFTVNKLYCVAPEGLARGQLFSAKIKLLVEIQSFGGGFEKVNVEADGIEATKGKSFIIEGIASSPYQIQTSEINLGGYVKPVKIKVSKLEFGEEEEKKEEAFEITRKNLKDLPEDTPLENKRADEIVFQSITLGKRVKTAYPNTALVFLSIDSETYGTLPARSYEVKGLQVKIPMNATPIEDGSLEFNPEIVFDGTLKQNKFYTTCPVCCFYDLLTNKRYGAGDFIDESNLNWVDLIHISKYCNERVTIEELDSEGNKKTEPRFAINTVIGSQAEAYNVLQDMASVFRGMLFWKADNVQVAADHGGLLKTDVEPVHVYSNSNVVDGSFVYSGSSLKTRSTRVRVRYNDPQNFYKPNFIVIEDRKLIDKYGIQEKTVVAFGCTSKFQAQRMGRWIMESEKLHDETVAFSVGLEGLNVLPGQVFEVSDEMRLGVRLAGRIVGAGEGFVDIDQTAVMPSGSNNKLTVVMADGTIETQSIQGESGTRINLSSNFSQVPPDNALYAIRNDSAKLTKFRCLSVTEGEEGTFAITGVKHQDGIYRAVEDPNDPVTLADPFFYGTKPDKPSNLTILFEPIDDGSSAKTRATISWTRGATAPVDHFEVEYQFGSGNIVSVVTSNNSIDVNSNLSPGVTLRARVRAVGLPPKALKSDFEPADFSGKQIPAVNTSELGNVGTVGGAPIVVLPPDPKDVSIEVMGGDQVVLNWAGTVDGQKLNNFIAHIRHSSKTDGTGAWTNSVLIRKVEARTTSVVLPLMNGEYLIKFVNEQKQYSLNAASAVVNVPDTLPKYNFEVVREDASPGEFPGQKINVVYSSEFDGLVFDGDASFDDLTDIDGFTANLDTHLGTRFTSGEYVFQKIVDLGAVYSVQLSRLLFTRSLDLNALIDDFTGLIDNLVDFDGEVNNDTNVELYFRKSNAGISSSGTAQENGFALQLEDGGNIKQESDLVFEDWVPLENNVYVGRSFQFKAVLSSENTNEIPLIDKLGVSVRFERRTENSGTIQSGTEKSGKLVTFENAFYTDGDTKVTVGITAFDLGAGDYYVLSEPTATGFTIVFKSLDGRVINRDFQYTAVGYGTRQA